ncbi:hypothetical protein SAMN05421820_116101 [Pedobacter steynii]|uniref:Uncharacterized protein n=1 Tax=Pedobacter steynii TaxID=430522 RepID=A0A1H0KN48_9SPHI|nr:hypothetical protein [Pedobacter steynii]NQX43333.1 hypothetical protein [Pedobacter steynii]SDO57180.1 hypothetical protein SAMN05421820_116101 [Pedobacter steynii]
MGPYIKSFRDVIEELKPQSEEEIKFLPLCHTTTQGYAISIMHEKGAIPKPCKVYNENLVYFFYGKSSYITSEDLSSYTDDPPMTFIFDIKTIGTDSFKRILPFDSGGFTRMKSIFHKENYVLEDPDIFHVLAFIKLLFGNNEAYIQSKVNVEELSKHKDCCLEIGHLINLYQQATRGERKVGPQFFSIEAQCDKVIQFTPTHLVLPYEFYNTVYWGTNFKNQFPNIQLHQYGHEESLARPGIPLEAWKHQDLMSRKVEEIITGLS